MIREFDLSTNFLIGGKKNNKAARIFGAMYRAMANLKNKGLLRSPAQLVRKFTIPAGFCTKLV